MLRSYSSENIVYACVWRGCSDSCRGALGRADCLATDKGGLHIRDMTGSLITLRYNTQDTKLIDEKGSV